MKRIPNKQWSKVNKLLYRHAGIGNDIEIELEDNGDIIFQYNVGSKFESPVHKVDTKGGVFMKEITWKEVSNPTLL